MTNPKTDDEFEIALEKLGVKLIDTGGGWVAQYYLGGSMPLEAEPDDYSGALFEAWNAYKDEHQPK